MSAKPYQMGRYRKGHMKGRRWAKRLTAKYRRRWAKALMEDALPRVTFGYD
jgi:hypothetical protein